MQKAVDFLEPFFEPGLSLIVIILFLILNSWVFSKMKSVKESTHIVRRTISFVIVLIGALVFILSLPVEQNIKGQVLSFLGIIISAGIALSSTTVLGNLIAGIMNNSMNRFRNGDLIKVADFQGRVTRKSAFHTEIQLEDSNFMTIPNLFIATQPVKLTRKTNTVISTTVSLGYDVPRNKIEQALKEAANSLLNAKVMDLLHQKEIEIVSPSFMNQRRVDEQKFVPPVIVQEPEAKKEETPEELIFTEANEAEKIENKKDYISRIEKKKQELKERLKELKEEEEIERVKSILKRLDETREKIQKDIEEQDEKNKEG